MQPAPSNFATDLRSDALAVLDRLRARATPAVFRKKQSVFLQGAVCDALFYIESGRIRLSVLSPQGKEAVTAILGPGDFLGETSLTARPECTSTATAITHSSLLRIEKSELIRLFRQDSGFAEFFLAFLLCRNKQLEDALTDQIFHSSEKRLARVLLMLAGKSEPALPRISQETLAEMVGTTRSRISFFMNRFRRLGFIEYGDGLRVHRKLLSLVLRDSAESARKPSASEHNHMARARTG